MATPQQFCVRWNSHLGSLGAAFPQLLAGGRFVDCTLACEGRQLSCHRLVLAACSGFFENLLGENPCQHPIIILKDVRFWELQALVDFMYKGEVNVTQEGLQDLLKCAETLQIRGLSGADSALKSLSESVNKPEESCNSNSSNHHLNNVVKEETVPYREEKESNVSKMVDCKPNISDIQDRMIEHNNSDEPDMDSADSRYSNDAMDEMAMNIKSEVCIDEGPMNKTQSDFAMANVSCEYQDSFDLPSSGRSNISSFENSFNNMSDCLSGGDNNTPRRIRRSEALLKQAADCVSRGQTFQHVSDLFSIPISTIRFFMARKGILPRRKRGRSSGIHMGGGGGGGSGPGSPVNSVNSLYQFASYKLPALQPKLM